MAINQISPAIAILISIAFICFKYWKKEKIELTGIIISIMAGGMLPLAFGFVVYPFYPLFIGDIREMGLQITLTGIILMYVYIKTIIEKLMESS